MLKNLFKKYYYVRCKRATGYEYTTVCCAKSFAEIHWHCYQRQDSKFETAILDIRKISKKDYDYFITQDNKTYMNGLPPASHFHSKYNQYPEQRYK